MTSTDSSNSPPRRLAQLGSDKLLLLLVGLALLGGLLILLREVNYGAVVSWDSVIYMSTAENTAAGRWFIRFPGLPLINWPPMYPLLMAPIVLLGFDVHGSAGFVNAAAFTLTVLFSALWLRRHLDSRLLVVWGTLAVMVSIPLTNLAARALSEPPFVLFALLALIQTEKFLSGGRRSSLTWAAVFTALACLTRYMGGAVLVAVVLLLLFQRNAAPREKAVRIAVYSLISAAPVCLWLLRNVLIIGRPTSLTDWEPTTPLLSNLRLALETLVAWVFPVARIPNGLEDLAAPLALIALLLMAGAAAHVLLRTRGEAGAGIGLGPLVPVGVFVLVYTVLIIASGFSVDIGSGNFSRYLSPIYAPLVFIVALTADRLSKRARLETLIGNGGWPVIRTLVRGGGQSRSTLGAILLVGLFLALAYPVAANVSHAQRHIDRGLSYESEKWVDSELMQSLKAQLDLDPGAVFYTNHQPAVWLHHRVTVNGLERQSQMDDLKQAASANEDDIYIAYFYEDYGRPSLMPQIESLDVESALEVEDGIMYRCCGTGPETDK